MATNYTTLSVVKATLGITDTTDDAWLDACIDAASRAIEQITGRVYFATTATRRFTADSWEHVNVPDLLTITSLKTDEDGDRTYEVTWAVADYDLEDYNQPPYYRIRVAPQGTHTFPSIRQAVEIAGTWGYASATPGNISTACQMLAIRLFKFKDSPEGVLGSDAMGAAIKVAKSDSRIVALLPPKRAWVG
jgi:uncharacterized phiE125 gp8 family phage protein